MSRPAHLQAVLAGTKKLKPVNIPISSIASTGFPLTQYADVAKVQRKLESARVKLAKLTSSTDKDVK